MDLDNDIKEIKERKVVNVAICITPKKRKTLIPSQSLPQDTKFKDLADKLYIYHKGHLVKTIILGFR